MKTKNRILNYNYYKNFINIISTILYFQIIYGAFNAGLKSVNAINTFPFYEGSILPLNLLILKPLYLNFFENHLSVQFIHRYFALIILILVSVFSYKLSFIKNRVNIYTQYFLLIVFLQTMLGVLTLVANAPLFFALSHQTMAAFLIMLSFKIKHMMEYE
jgi:cytochrome c oxidase assembly protein subunit 15